MKLSSLGVEDAVSRTQTCLLLRADLRLSSSRCRVSFSSRSESYMPPCARPVWSGYVSFTTAQPRKSHCLSAYASTDATSQTTVVLSLSLARLVAIRHVRFRGSRLSRLCRLLVGKAPCEARHVGEMITRLCGLLKKIIPDSDHTRLDPRAGIVFLFVFDDVAYSGSFCPRLRTRRSPSPEARTLSVFGQSRSGCSRDT